MSKSSKLLHLDPFAEALKRKEREQPVNQLQDSRLTTLVNQSLVNQSTSPPANELSSPPVNSEASFPSRVSRRLKGVRLPEQKLAKWELWCFLNNVDFQDAVERAMDWLTSQPANELSTCQFDDLDNGETDEVIILYRRLTGNKWTKKDDEARVEVSQYSSHVIRAGIVVSLLRTKNRINSFRYCLGAIHETAQANPGEDYLNYLLAKMSKG